MIFLRYENFKQYLKWYPVTSLILVIQISLYIVIELIGDSTDPETLIRFGAMYNLPMYSPEYWRYFSAIFLHIGIDHLLFNSFAIFIFAPPLERMLGTAKYILFYLGSGFAGNVLTQLLRHDVYYSAGASGAIYGIYAAFLFLGLFRKDLLDQQSRQTITIILIVGFIYSIINSHVNFYGHLGGFVGGFLIISLISKKFKKSGQ